MKIEVFAICYNEERLLPYFLRHYSSFCDEITIYDNQSTDSGPALCKANPKVHLISYDTSNEIRDDIYLQIKNNCWKRTNADWVIICDIDELVYNPHIREYLEETEYTAILPSMFNMYSEKFPTTPGQIYDEVNKGVPCGPKLNLFKPSDIKEINYDPGCHIAHPEGNVTVDKNSDIITLHMRYLSKEYLIERNRMSYQRLSKVNKKMGWGVHYGFPIEELKQQFDKEFLLTTKVI